MAPLPSKMRANVLRRGLPRLISDCAVDSVAATFVFARLVDIGWAASACLRGFLYDGVDLAIVFVPEWHAKCLKWGLRGDALPGVAHAKVAPHYVKDFRDAVMSQEFAEAV